MIKLPVKDPATIPWMSQREIPAIKVVLSAWRKLRKDKANIANAHDLAALCERPELYARITAACVAWDLEKLAATEERLRKEAKK